MSFAEKLKELSAVKAQAATLEAEISRYLSSDLAALPAQFGFDSVGSFIAAVKRASRSGMRNGGRTLSAAKGKTATRKRAKITDAVRAAVKMMVEEKKTGAEIAKELGISIPSVQNIKKAMGLVKKQKR